ncbi:MAG: hypothetical protein QNK05_02455 [Myxococcota bacterium]|nr:hypothetical protein [Myxococcota bacterium]
MSAFSLGLRLLALTLLLDASLHWFERVPVMMLAGTALLVPWLLQSRAIWIALTLATGASVIWDFPFADNHDHLMAFSCLAVVCALHTRDPERAFATSARLLIGLAFLFAVIWKVGLSPEFRDGRFFRVTLLTDTRFADLAVMAGGLDWDRWEANGDLLADTLSGREPWPEGGFDEPPALRRLATFATVYTGAIEAFVALAFLLPPTGRFGGRIARFRDASLLLFAVTTYAFATVRGFGWLLMVLGVSQCESRRMRVAYVATFFLIEAYRSVPWSDAVIALMGRGPS